MYGDVVFRHEEGDVLQRVQRRALRQSSKNADVESSVLLQSRGGLGH